mmetsp:Transcript_24196/g.72695  ORF Transcript_24196/g.72695 Transcript_24196/m.72695 type:complete len:401 (-) Transcript_24196:86-1288(-)
MPAARREHPPRRAGPSHVRARQLQHPRIATLCNVRAQAGRHRVERRLRRAIEEKRSSAPYLTRHLRAQSAMKRRRGALLDGLAEDGHDRPAVQERRQALVALAQACADDARVDRARHDVLSLELPLQVLRVQAIQGLGDAVLRELVVLLPRAWQHVWVHTPATGARHRGQHDDPHFGDLGGLLHPGHQELRQQEVAQVVCGEHELEALGRRDPFRGSHDARIAYEVMQWQVQGQERLHKRLNGGQVRQLDTEDCGLAMKFAFTRFQALQGGLSLAKAAHRPHHMAPVLHQTSGVLQTKAIAGTCDDGHLACKPGEIALAAHLFDDLLARTTSVSAENLAAADADEACDKGVHVHSRPHTRDSRHVRQELAEIRPPDALFAHGVQQPLPRGGVVHTGGRHC